MKNQVLEVFWRIFFYNLDPFIAFIIASRKNLMPFDGEHNNYSLGGLKKIAVSESSRKESKETYYGQGPGTREGNIRMS